jgi:hypothetical protein
MITFVLAVAVLVGALCVGTALEGVDGSATGRCRIACPGCRTASWPCLAMSRSPFLPSESQ